LTTRHRIVVADDNDFLLQFVSIVLGETFDIVATARNGDEAIKAVCKFKPEVLVLDITMPELDGIQTALRLKQTGSPVKVVFLTSLEDTQSVERGMATGASGFVFKRRIFRDLSYAIREALAGRTFVSSLPS
jgi:DNA-binding NarL/FixJ family response regulator